MRRKILVVDDDPDQIELIRWNLKKAGFAIGTAATGFEALVKARSLSPDLIVLDLMLPEANGFDLCKALRQDPATTATPIIMLTGMRTQFSRLMGFESGINAFLTKPFNPEELVSKVEELLALPSTSSDTSNQAQPEQVGAEKVSPV